MATARHPKATFFVQRHLFSGLTRFAELESKIAALPDEQARGAAFEVFAEAYLATQRKHDAAQVWPHGTVPLDLLKNLGLTQSDQGVDDVLQTLLGQFNAYQVKFRTGRPALTWRELSTFIGLADDAYIAPKKSPQPHQTEALAALLPALQTHDRVSAIMACGTGGLLVIDEAQHLSVAALDQIRSIHDATDLGIALVGNQQVYARLTGGNRAAY